MSCLRSKLQQQEGKTYILCLSLLPFYLSNTLSENEKVFGLYCIGYIYLRFLIVNVQYLYLYLHKSLGHS